MYVNTEMKVMSFNSSKSAIYFLFKLDVPEAKLGIKGKKSGVECVVCLSSPAGLPRPLLESAEMSGIPCLILPEARIVVDASSMRSRWSSMWPPGCVYVAKERQLMSYQWEGRVGFVDLATGELVETEELRAMPMAYFTHWRLVYRPFPDLEPEELEVDQLFHETIEDAAA